MFQKQLGKTQLKGEKKYKLHVCSKPTKLYQPSAGRYNLSDVWFKTMRHSQAHTMTSFGHTLSRYSRLATYTHRLSVTIQWFIISSTSPGLYLN